MSAKRFLEFNGKSVYFLSKEGVWWIAIKPICEAVGVNYNRQFQSIKEDPILLEAFALQQIVAADGKLRKMVCLPEFYVYGWIFGIQSDSTELKAYKWECYQVLYNHFHGTITQRTELLRQRLEEQREIQAIETRLAATEDYRRLIELKGHKSSITKGLTALDKALSAEQLDLFEPQNN